jgi:ABC-2 type transport system permease protein
VDICDNLQLKNIWSINMLYLAINYFRIGIQNELQYRVNFFVQLGQSAISLATGLIGLWLVFSQTNELNGWTQPELIMVMGIFIFMGGVINSLIQPNMTRLLEEIQMGTLDFLLTKPMDAQGLISIREFRLWSLTDVFVGMLVLSYGVYHYQGTVGVTQSLAFILTLLLGSIIIYCFWLIITSTAFWIVRVDEIVNLFQGVYAAGRWPVSIYPQWLRVGLTFIIPVAFAVTIPANALTSRLTPLILVGTFVLTIFFVILARYIWRRGLKNYSGASA